MNIKSIITAVIGLLVSTACSGGAKQEKVMNKDGKAIVVFFSHAGDNYAVGNIEVGNTKIVADYITELTGAEQFEIVTHKYDGMAYNPLIKLAQEEARNGELPEYEGDIDLSKYDTVFCRRRTAPPPSSEPPWRSSGTTRSPIPSGRAPAITS